MAKHTEEAPVTVEDGRNGTITTHPAFAQVSVHRINGSRVLYGSDFRHHSFVRVTVQSSDLRRDLSHDWHYGRQHLIDFDMSEAQWATFVSSFNIGGGVPCTLHYVDKKVVPDIPLRDERNEYKKEMNKNLDSLVATIDAAIGRINEMTTGLSRPKREAVVAELTTVRQQLASNLPFVVKSHDEHMEKRVEKAKIEINAYMTQVIHRAGLNALTDGRENEVGPLLLNHNPSDK